MMKQSFAWSVLGALVIACLVSSGASAQLLRTLVFDGQVNVEAPDSELRINDPPPTYSGNGDFSDTGLDLGNDGYLFAQFNAQSEVSLADLAPPTDNDRDTLPSWFSVNDYGDAGVVYSVGGFDTWPSYTLPDGSETGLSGAWVDALTDPPDQIGGTDAVFNEILLGPDTPRDFLLHVVTDNTNNEYDSNNRIRIRTRDAGGAWENDIRLRVNAPPPNFVDNFDNNVDVYTFQVINYRENDIIRLQVNPDTSDFASLSGLMIDVIDPRPIPEPSAIALGLVGLASVVLGGRRLRQAS